MSGYIVLNDYDDIRVFFTSIFCSRYVVGDC